jgi:hypothetical protein
VFFLGVKGKIQRKGQTEMLTESTVGQNVLLSLSILELAHEESGQLLGFMKNYGK